MAVATATLGGRDSTCIGIDLFGEELDGGIGGNSEDFSEHQMQECE